MQVRSAGSHNWFTRLRRSDISTALLFLLPSLVILGVFNFYPIAGVFRLSFFKWDNLSPTKTFIGLDNFIRLFQSERFWNSLKVTAEYTLVVTAVSLFLGLVLAVFLNNRMLLGKSFWRSMFFLPVVTPTVAAAMVWILLFNPGFGLVNVVLRALGLDGLNWLADKTWALPTVMSLGIWRRLGFTLILYLAALQSLSKEYYESAEIDGANALQRFLHITVPLLRSTTIMLVILGVIDSFLVFDQVMVLTRGGPDDATEVIGMFMYLNSFSLFKLGYGAAISVVMFVVVAVFTLMQWRFVGFGSAGEAE
ncbi:MAG: sugar ABC transporter permease [Chloroflexi bacterium]|nr:ABC transporter permease [Anaerolinea sp.]TDA63532.1 MAG: sugar ABC transporter permease [Chloroflexota bacterium]